MVGKIMIKSRKHGNEPAMTWNRTKPPAPGWYAAKRIRDRDWSNGWRWWDGERWSWPAFPHESLERVGKWAEQKEPKGHNVEIMWSVQP